MRKGKKRAITGFGFFLLAVFALSIVFYMNFKTVVVSGVSMWPTLKNGQRVLVSNAYWLVGPIRHKDVIVIQDENPSGFMIKRVYRMAGEKVDYINWPRDYSLANGELIVPDGHVFVLGDNRKHSEDSRSYGPVDVTKVLGKVVVLR
jgi:signal peptidase I